MKPIWADGLVTCWNTREKKREKIIFPYSKYVHYSTHGYPCWHFSKPDGRDILWRETIDDCDGRGKLWRETTLRLWQMYMEATKMAESNKEDEHNVYHKMTRFFTLSLSIKGATGNPSSFSTSL